METNTNCPVLLKGSNTILWIGIWLSNCYIRCSINVFPPGYAEENMISISLLFLYSSAVVPIVAPIVVIYLLSAFVLNISATFLFMPTCTNWSLKTQPKYNAELQN